jgi:hypothetical protein
MNSKEDERVAHCSVEQWEAGSTRVTRVVVEMDVSLAGSNPTTKQSLLSLRRSLSASDFGPLGTLPET